VHPLGLIFGLFAIGTVLLDAFETIILPRRASGKIRLTWLFYTLTWRPWAAVVSRYSNRRLRETGFSFYGPLSLLFLMALWAAGLVLGFGFMFWGLGAPLHDPLGLHPLHTAIYISGTTLFTLGLGDIIPLNHWARDLVIIEAGTGLGFVMITVALGQIVWGVAYRWISLTNGDNGVSISVRPAPFGLSLADASAFYWACLVVFLIAVAVMSIFVESPFGAALRGTRDQPRRMTALGYNVWLTRFLAFLFSGFWSGVAGLLYLYYNQFISPQAVALSASAEALLMVIAGGTATLLGPIAGAALVIIMKDVASAYIERWNFVLGAIFVLIVVFMPEGLVPGCTRFWHWAIAARRRARAPASVLKRELPQ